MTRHIFHTYFTFSTNLLLLKFSKVLKSYKQSKNLVHKGGALIFISGITKIGVTGAATHGVTHLFS